ncbi:MFS transporter [Flammeovirga agarivorans]|uniref:MFS transporter n=1 Tax=Flammeovirga agarivorans TaxID=2726742 RepID=A0A7X8SP44_9BACT|nr:MFS transporter [Flammeovirga agarivorans]NLR93715.1 MFS transporter [Flammeovirga agarivorans]
MTQNTTFKKDILYWRFSAYGFLKNLRFFDPFMIIYLSGIGVSYTQIGVLYGIRKLVAFFLEVPTGILADKMGRKQSLSLAFLAYIISFLIIYLYPNFYLLILSFTFFGLAETLRSGTHKAIILSYLEIKGWEDQKADYFGHTRGWAQMGSAISSLVAGVLVFNTEHFNNIFLFSIVPYVINFFNIITYPKELNTGKASKKKKTESFNSEMLTALKNPHLIKVIGNSTTLASFLGAVKDFIQPIMATFALSLVFIKDIGSEHQRIGIVVGVLYFIIYFLNSTTSINAKKITKGFSDQPSYITVTLIAGLVVGICSGIFYEFNFVVLSLISFSLLYIIDSLRKPFIFSYIMDDTPSDMTTTFLSIQSFVSTIATAVLSFLFGYLADHFSIGEALVIVGIMLLVLYLTVLMFYHKNKKKS